MTYIDFVNAHLVNPIDNAPLLVFADWLDERNDPLGQLIRFMIFPRKSHWKKNVGKIQKIVLKTEHPKEITDFVEKVCSMRSLWDFGEDENVWAIRLLDAEINSLAHFHDYIFRHTYIFPDLALSLSNKTESTKILKSWERIFKILSLIIKKHHELVDKYRKLEVNLLRRKTDHITRLFEMNNSIDPKIILVRDYLEELIEGNYRNKINWSNFLDA